MLNRAPTGTQSLTAAISVAHRPDPLTLHLFWPAGAETRETVLFSHGDKLSPPDYAPLLQAWALQGLAIIAPDHAGTTRCPLWLARALDMYAAAEHRQAFAALVSRPAHAPIRLAGHSYGSHTVALLLGGRPTLVASPESLALPQADAGLKLAPPGDGSAASLAPEWAVRAPYLCLDVAGVRIPSLIIAGGRDASSITRPGWRWDAGLSTERPTVLRQDCGKYVGVAPEGDHYLGGIATGRGATKPALFAEIAAITADYLLRGPAWAPPARPTDHLSFNAQSGMQQKDT